MTFYWAMSFEKYIEFFFFFFFFQVWFVIADAVYVDQQLPQVRPNVNP